MTPSVTCSMCMAVNPKNACVNCGTFLEISAYSPPAPLGGVTPKNEINPGKYSPSSISLLHSMPWSTMNAVPNTMVASSQLRVHARSCRCDANTARTMVKELDSRHAVITVALVMLATWNGVGQGLV